MNTDDYTEIRIPTYAYRSKFRETILNYISNNNEEWAFHPEFELLLVSNKGKVKNAYSGNVYKDSKTVQGYHNITVRENGKRSTKLVHKLVAETWLPYVVNDFQIFEVNHMNGDKSDNSVYNLEWMLRKENLKHAKTLKGSKKRVGKPKVHSSIVLEIKEFHSAGFYINEISKYFNLEYRYVWSILNGSRRKDVV